MSLSISNIGSNIGSIVMPQVGSISSAPSGGGTFQNMLESAIGNVETLQKNADSAAQDFITGKNEDIHTVALATQQSELAFELGLQIRNKVVSAYQEVMKMQL
jgi:flagellar hook-basal body complex protein FliE